MPETAIQIDEQGIYILASSHLYDAILNDGRRVDLYDLVFGTADGNLSGGISSLLSNISSFAKKLVSKPIKALWGLSMDAASLGAFGPVGQVAANVLEMSGTRDAISKGDWTAAQRNLRNFLQGNGIVPSTDQAYLAYEQSVLTSMADQYMTGAYGPGNVTSDWMKYLPWGIVAILIVLILARR